ncbi:methyltransferase domain-containing protein [Clostridium sp. AF19-22AC]|jgi:trans-aconitate 2-methyltransferase|uniref:class I SAM-dependent methyltransferase n=1 Tax=Clostridia TaxID=186801 RepID=UPI000E5105CC|nr:MULTISPECIES: class I SAM-dependent methyltransferase [Clostridia]RHR27630.1 methyltransferase domain-containing protein [Clostridium sp. AF19-22AC]
MEIFEFDGQKYKQSSKHQKEWGKELISQLALKGDETILDLGCGDGILTEQLSSFVPNGKVIGIDASTGMIETAKEIKKINLEFIQMDINNLSFADKFDIIFSNAALHWIKDHNKLLRKAYKALKTNGVILWDFGASGNCSNFFEVVQNKIKDERYTQNFENFEWPWYMPSLSEYENLVSSIGFSETSISEINRDRFFSDSSEMIKWIDQPSIVPFLQYLPDDLKNTFRQEVVEEMIKKTHQKDGSCFETFRRIRVYAVK